MTPQLVPLGVRLGALQVARVALATAVVVLSVAGSEVKAHDASPSLVGGLTVMYLLLTGGAELFRRRRGVRALQLVSALLLLDGLYLIVIAADAGLTDPWTTFLIPVHVAVTVLLVSFRSGLGVALWDAVLLIVFASVTGVEGDSGWAIAVFALSLVLMAVAVAASAWLNEQALREATAAADDLLSLANELERSRSVDDVAVAAVSHLGRVPGVARAAVAFLDGSRWRGAITERGTTCLVVTDPGLSVQVVREPRDVAHRLLPAAVQNEIVGLVDTAGTHGVLMIEAGRQPWSSRRLDDHMDQVRQRVVLAIRTVRLLEEIERVAATDPLTTLPNRRTFDRELTKEVTRARRNTSPLALAIIDVDHFKRVNDEHGHPVGDEVLRQLADRLRSTSRADATLCRYGGEEFAMVLPETTRQEARVVGERLRDAAAQVRAVPITISVGVAVLDHDDADGGDLVRAADLALYAAKATGRDRVVTDTEALDLHHEPS